MSKKIERAETRGLTENWNRTPMESQDQTTTPRTVGTKRTDKGSSFSEPAAASQDDSVPTGQRKGPSEPAKARRKASVHRDSATALGKGKPSTVVTE
jgi:hypothetical protein